MIRSIQDAVDIVDVIGRSVELKRSGASHKGLCPFHDEKTPSFHVFPNSQRFQCFGCGEGGDVFEFLMKHGNLGFRDAVEELARETGITIPVVEEGPEEAERNRRRAAALHALEFALGFYRAVLERPIGAEARAYLQRRGFEPATLETFGIGFSPDDYHAFSNYARSKGIRDEALFDAGLIRRKEDGRPYDMFRGRIMFPIRDLRGDVIGFGARAMGDAQPKYLNSPDGPLFHKGREVYGLDVAAPAARRAGRLLVVEGYTDVMQCHQGGVSEVVAGLGTALTTDNALRLRRMRVPVVLLYDGDEAGRRAAERAADVFLSESVEGSVALLPPGQDPADLIVAEGVERLEEAISQSHALWDYRVESVLGRHDLDSLEGRGRAVHELVETIGRMRDRLRQDVAIKLLSERMGIPEATLRSELGDKTRRPNRDPERSEAAPPAGEAWVRAEREILAAAMVAPDLWERVLECYPPTAFRDPALREIALAIGDLQAGGQSLDEQALLARLLERGGSPDGDDAVDALGTIQPSEDVVERATVHLARLARDRELKSAVAAESLEAVVRARKRTSS